MEFAWCSFDRGYKESTLGGREMKKLIGRNLVVFAALIWAVKISAMPITGSDIVNVNGVEWAQVDLFTNLSWLDVSAVCPGGICTNSDTLNGFDVEGWVWAASEEVVSLFNNYIGSPALGPAPSFYFEAESSWGPAFFSDGWRATANIFGGPSVSGITSQATSPGAAYLATFIDRNPGSTAQDLVSVSDVLHIATPERGAWLYRPAAVPVPATLSLVGLALLGFAWTRRSRRS